VTGLSVSELKQMVAAVQAGTESHPCLALTLLSPEVVEELEISGVAAVGVLVAVVLWVRQKSRRQLVRFWCCCYCYCCCCCCCCCCSLCGGSMVVFLLRKPLLFLTRRWPGIIARAVVLTPKRFSTHPVFGVALAGRPRCVRAAMSPLP
jgi:hypothetical protein